MYIIPWSCELISQSYPDIWHILGVGGAGQRASGEPADDAKAKGHDNEGIDHVEEEGETQEPKVDFVDRMLKELMVV